jgi:hypothetical protein
MASARTFKVGPRRILAGDGGLVTAGAFVVVLGLGPLLGADSPVSNVALLVGIAAALCLAPLLAWRLHGRHVDGTSTGGALLGYLAGAVLVSVYMLLAVVFEWVFTTVGLYAAEDHPESVVGLIATAAAIVAYLAVAAWLDVDAVRDLSPKRREHAWLDVARLAASVAFVAYLVGVTVRATGDSEFDYVGPTLVLVAAGAVGAAAVTVADRMVRRGEQRSHAHLVSGA